MAGKGLVLQQPRVLGRSTTVAAVAAMKMTAFSVVYLCLYQTEWL